MLAIWLERSNELPGALVDDLSWLGDAERRRSDALGSARRRGEFLAGRSLLRRILVDCGLAAGCERVSLTAHGAPRFQGRPEVHLSLSHRRGWLVAAVSDAAVGVDIEIQAPRDVPALATRFCTERETRDLDALEPLPALWRLHELWALKEAAFKAAWPQQQDLPLSRLECVPVAQGGAGRSWRWPDGRVLAVVAKGIERVELQGLEGASAPRCWEVSPGPVPSEPAPPYGSV